MPVLVYVPACTVIMWLEWKEEAREFLKCAYMCDEANGTEMWGSLWIHDW